VDLAGKEEEVVSEKAEIVLRDSAAIESMTLDQLVDYARSEHDLTVRALSEGLAHAVNVGMALLVARQHVEPGSYKEWLKRAVGIDHATAWGYIRLAHHRESITPNLSVRDALVEIRGLPPAPQVAWRGGGPTQTEDELRIARDMRSEGASLYDISLALGRTSSTIHHWLNPDLYQRDLAKRRKQREQGRQARKALSEQKRRSAIKAAAKRSGTAIHHTYSELRAALAVIDQAILDANDPNPRSALRLAREYLYKAEDKIAEALRVS
jgi:hypothetical protein